MITGDYILFAQSLMEYGARTATGLPSTLNQMWDAVSYSLLLLSAHDWLTVGGLFLIVIVLTLSRR